MIVGGELRGKGRGDREECGGEASEPDYGAEKFMGPKKHDCNYITAAE